MSDLQAMQAIPHEVLISELLDSRVSKTEREHAAAREILDLRQAIAEAEDAVAAEREACAQACEDLIGTRAMARHCADSIRARGEK